MTALEAFALGLLFGVGRSIGRWLSRRRFAREVRRRRETRAVFVGRECLGGPHPIHGEGCAVCDLRRRLQEREKGVN